jgi:hypothetical protein
MPNNPFGFSVPGVLPLLLGMVHVQALPGTPFSTRPIPEIAEIAVSEAVALKKAGFHGIILENMHDRPYLKGRVGPEITAGMTAVAQRIRDAVGNGFPIGIQILAGANQEALAVALAADLQFIRAEGFVFAHVADEGWIEACAGELLRERRRLGADHIKIWTDIQKKHSAHAVTADLDLAEWGHGAEFFGADGVIVTGAHTGSPADVDDLDRVRRAVKLPVAIGSGITPDNAAQFAQADAWIIGSSIKKGGYWANPLDLTVVRALIEAHAGLPRAPKKKRKR